MLYQFNMLVEKIMPVMAPIAVLLGLFFASELQPIAYLVPWIFALITFAGSLGSNFQDLRKVAHNPLPLIVCLAIIHFVMPAIAWMTGRLVFPGDTLTVTGLVLMFIIPTGIVSVVWVAIARGSVPLTLILIVVDTLLLPFFVPYGLSLFIGTGVQIDSFGIMLDMLWMVVLPSLIGMACNQLTGGKVKETWGKSLAPFSKLALGGMIAINSSSIIDHVKQLDGRIAFLVLITSLLALSGYAVGYFTAKLFRWDYETAVALTINTGMRSLGAGIVISVLYFPPAVTLPVVIGSALQQTFAALAVYALRKVKERTAIVGNPTA